MDYHLYRCFHIHGAGIPQQVSGLGKPSAVMVTPKKVGCRMVGDYRKENNMAEKVPDTKPNREGELEPRAFFGRLDMLRGYWRMPLAREVQEILTIATPWYLCIPTRVLQGVFDVKSSFQDTTMTEVLDGLSRLVRMDDAIHLGHDGADLLNILDTVLERLKAGL